VVIRSKDRSKFLLQPLTEMTTDFTVKNQVHIFPNLDTKNPLLGILLLLVGSAGLEPARFRG
jgi:hypothetical protein